MFHSVQSLTIQRHVPWVDSSIIIIGVDWSAGDFAMQVRPAPGDSATPLIDLATATAGLEGISASYDADYVYPDEGSNVALRGSVVGATTITRQIDKASLEAISWGQSDPDAPLLLHFDMIFTPPDIAAFVGFSGTIDLQPGVTIP